MDTNSFKNIKNLNEHKKEILSEIENTQEKISEVLKARRKIVLEEFDKKIGAYKEQIQQEEAKKKENQYDYKQKEQEQIEHLETMT